MNVGGVNVFRNKTTHKKKISSKIGIETSKRMVIASLASSSHCTLV